MSTVKHEIDYLPADKATLKGEVTKAQIDAWKQQYAKGIFRVISDDDQHVGYFRNPYRGDVNNALAAANAKEPLASITHFTQRLYLGGSEAILNDDAVFLGVTVQLRTKMNGVNATLENL